MVWTFSFVLCWMDWRTFLCYFMDGVHNWYALLKVDWIANHRLYYKDDLLSSCFARA